MATSHPWRTDHDPGRGPLWPSVSDRPSDDGAGLGETAAASRGLAGGGGAPGGCAGGPRAAPAANPEGRAECEEAARADVGRGQDTRWKPGVAV